jgi:hypothetical protein
MISAHENAMFLDEPSPTDRFISRLVLDYLEKSAVNEAYCEMLKTDPALVEECDEYRELIGSEEDCAEILPVGTSISLIDIIREYLAMQTIMKNFMGDLSGHQPIKAELFAANGFQKKLQFILKLLKGNLEFIEVAKAVGLESYVSDYEELEDLDISENTQANNTGASSSALEDWEQVLENSNISFGSAINSTES